MIAYRAVTARQHPDFGGAYYAVVEIGGLDTAHLGAEERAIFEAMKATEKRRREWLAGRRAAHLALASLGHEGAQVLREPSGAPRTTAAGVHVAITHGKRFAAAVATSGAACPHAGIDIVDAEDLERIEHVAQRVLTPDEQQRARANPEHAKLAWATREAVAKATRTGMFVFALAQCWTVAVDDRERRVWTNLEGIEVVFEPLSDGGVLVLAKATEAAYAAAQASAR